MNSESLQYKPPYEKLSRIDDWKNSKIRDKDAWTFSKHGLMVSAYTSAIDEVFQVNGLDIPVFVGDLMGEVTFAPRGSTRFQEQYRSIAISDWMKGMSAFFDFVDQAPADYPLPTYLIGDTNPRMAGFVRRFGIENGGYEEYSDGKRSIKVIGKMTRVRALFRAYESKLEENGTLEKIHAQADWKRKNIPVKQKIADKIVTPYLIFRGRF